MLSSISRELMSESFFPFRLVDLKRWVVGELSFCLCFFPSGATYSLFVVFFLSDNNRSWATLYMENQGTFLNLSCLIAIR